jgi:hypothetical protein
MDIPLPETNVQGLSEMTAGHGTKLNYCTRKRVRCRPFDYSDSKSTLREKQDCRFSFSMQHSLERSLGVDPKEPINHIAHQTLMPYPPKTEGPVLCSC